MNGYEKCDINKAVNIDLLELAESGGATLDEVLLTAAIPCTRLDFKKEKDQNALMKAVHLFLKLVRKEGRMMSKPETRRLLETKWLPSLEEEEKKKLIIGQYRIVMDVDEEGNVLFNPTHMASHRVIRDRGYTPLEYGYEEVNYGKMDGMVIKCNNWQEFASSAKNDKYYPVRMRVLERAHKYFQSVKSFNDLSVPVRKALAGLCVSFDNDGLDWKLFGSMIGCGTYKSDIGSEYSTQGGAIDLIPLEGEVTREDFMAYKKAFGGKQDPLATASRLLAIKRPDLFICIDSKNKEMLAHLLKCRKSAFKWDNYWELMSERIWQSEWYAIPESEVAAEDKQLWKYRAAMFDALTYEEAEG